MIFNSNGTIPEEHLEEVIRVTHPHNITHMERITGPRTQYVASNPEHIMNDDGTYSVITIGDPINIEGPEFRYNLNEEGFRSQPFGPMDHDNYNNVLFGGCSWTFGEGLPEEYTWVKLLSDKVDTLDVDKRVCYFNTGFPGSSIQLIVKNLLAFCRKYGNPEYIFACFPDIARTIYFSEQSGTYTKMFPNFQQFRRKLTPDQLEYSKNYIAENNALWAAEAIRHLEDYCDGNGIRLLWNSWHHEDYELLKKLNFKYFVPGDNSDTWRPTTWDQSNPFPHQNIHNLPYWEISRDDGHPGTCWTTRQAQVFHEEMLSRWF